MQLKLAEAYDEHADHVHDNVECCYTDDRPANILLHCWVTYVISEEEQMIGSG